MGALPYTLVGIAKMLDHALLKPTLTAGDLERGCQLALELDVASVCILPYSVRRCAELLQGSTVRTSTTIGFPHGGHATATKRAEARRAIDDGCEELDMVVNISQVLSGEWGYVTDDIAAVIEPAHAAGRKAKIIFENCYLEDAHKIRLCEICTTLNADWAKTSTGFGSGGATLPDIKLMVGHTGDNVQVKAAGGVRDFNTLLEVRALGVTRIGTSSSQMLLEQCRATLTGESSAATSSPDDGGY